MAREKRAKRAVQSILGHLREKNLINEELKGKLDFYTDLQMNFIAKQGHECTKDCREFVHMLHQHGPKAYKCPTETQHFPSHTHIHYKEKQKLSNRDQPLWERILQGPSDDIMKTFVMDVHEKEVSNDVAQYLNLELPILEQVLLKLREEESREIQRVISKYHHQHRLLSHMLNSKLSPHIETSV